MFYKWLVQFTACIHWFNPLIYFIMHETNKLCELSCDEVIIKNLGSKEKKRIWQYTSKYGRQQKKIKNPGMSVTLNEGSKLLKERLGKIMEFKKNLYHVSLSSLLHLHFHCVCYSSSNWELLVQKEQITAWNWQKIM